MNKRKCRICEMHPDDRQDLMRRWLGGASLRSIDHDLKLPHDSARHHITVCEAQWIFQARGHAVLPTEAQALLDERLTIDRGIVTAITTAATKGNTLGVERLIADYTKSAAPRLALLRYIADCDRQALIDALSDLSAALEAHGGAEALDTALAPYPAARAILNAQEIPDAA